MLKQLKPAERVESPDISGLCQVLNCIQSKASVHVEKQSYIHLHEVWACEPQYKQYVLGCQIPLAPRCLNHLVAAV